MSDKLLQYVPFSSALDTGFWYQLTKRKLDVFMLDDKPVSICGFYSNSNSSGLPPIANIDYSCFDETFQMPHFSYPLKGQLINTNTLEDFKLRDKKTLLNSLGLEIWDAVKSGAALENPCVLQRLLCFTFADLKKYYFYYWVAFPAFTLPEVKRKENSIKVDEYFSSEQLTQFLESYDGLSSCDKSAFLIHRDEKGNCATFLLHDFNELKSKPGKIILGFADPSTLESHPGWPLRNILYLAAYHWMHHQKDWDILCFREYFKDGKRHFHHSFVISVHLNEIDNAVCPDFVGWEKNQGNLSPKMVDMSASMDPAKLADSSVDLNLKLMRWRLIPELHLEVIKATKCLLFGAGTLGCNVARCLLGWGVRKITFVDNATVSFSNPVRQTLFTFEDSLHGGKHKAIAASEALKRIFPGVDTEGVVMNVPMPGHAVVKKAVKEIQADVSRIEELIESHDVIFLLMDTRESRWLPTLIGAAKEKIVLNAALGFDTFLVMRHGMKGLDNQCYGDFMNSKIVDGTDLGCYFCNDIVAPGNSTHDRTLDQQCTVTRPGVSFIASSLVVELMVSIMQHSKSGQAPASILGASDTSIPDLSTELGIVPHQIRGHLDKFQNTILTSKAFDRCTACSDKVVIKYKNEGFDFLLQVFNDPNYLEEVTGLKELMNSISMDEVFELSDDDSI
ncbi:LOW QUALITY PROTEIN: ubiquitin-like modifier-activating enzyme ATG7 [Uloborus diversus]|uniref:LOW QUALITY PROTEIN: ubiquitin-like modifier-activating enzyme ATG7 n=1 Tax=Uloborus diversus TaxID=327109 RepID=UPI0024095FD3|nr:LOW QUALITY PROTEIN: ubiquitin-like modifier-activating enzyme ATG7 [Uloborus diversus]